MDIENLDSANVPEHKDRDDLSDSCCTKQKGNVTSQVQDETAKETVPTNSEPPAQREAGSKHSFAGSNRSTFSGEKRRDRQWHDEHYRHRVDNRRQKLPSDASVRERGTKLDASDKVINGETTVCEPLMETADQCAYRDDETKLLTETRDSSSPECAAAESKPLMPSGRKQHSNTYQRRTYYTRGGRSHYSSASSHYDYDDYDDYVLQPKPYKDPKRNRQPKSAKTPAPAVSNEDGNNFDEEANGCHPDHAARSLEVSSEFSNVRVSSNKQNRSSLSYVPRQRRNNGYYRHRNTGDRQTSAAEENNVSPAVAANPEECQSNSTVTCDDTETKLRTQNRQPKKHWNRRAPDKASRQSVNEDGELQTTTDALSRLSVEVREGDDVQVKHETAEEMKVSSASTEPKRVKSGSVHQTSTSTREPVGAQMRRNNRTRRSGNRFIKDSASTDDQQCGQNQEVQKGDDIQVKHETKEEKDSSSSTELKHVKQTSTYSGSHREPVGAQMRRNNRTRRGGSHCTRELALTDDQQCGQNREVQKGDDIRGKHETTEEMKDSCTSSESKHVKPVSVHQTSTYSGSHREPIGAQNRRNNRTRRGGSHSTREPALTDDQQCGQNREVRKGDDVQVKHETTEMKDSCTSSESTHVKQVSMHQTSTYCGSHGGPLGAQMRRNNRTRQGGSHSTRDSASTDYPQCWQNQEDGSSSHAEKEPYQNRGSRRGGRRNRHQESQPSNNQYSHDQPTDCVDSLPDVPSATPPQNESNSHHSHPPGFHVHHRPTAATAQLPSS